jgi:hypothetical protein
MRSLRLRAWGWRAGGGLLFYALGEGALGVCEQICESEAGVPHAPETHTHTHTQGGKQEAGSTCGSWTKGPSTYSRPKTSRSICAREGHMEHTYVRTR